MVKVRRSPKLDVEDDVLTMPSELEGIAEKHAWMIANRSALQATKKNSGQGYTYADSADILAAIMPVVTAAGLSLSINEIDCKVDLHQQWDEEDGKFKFIVSARVTVEAVLVDPISGEEIRRRASNHAVDWNGDKACGKANTGALKYALRYLFLLATGEDSEDEKLDVANKGSGKRSRSGSNDLFD